MTVDSDTRNTTEASLYQHWHDVEWRQEQQAVRRLQVRIAKATQNGQWRMVRKLQSLLTNSRAARLIAVRRVTENSGKHTPGVDGTTWSTPEAKLQGVSALAVRNRRPLPLKRVYIPKANGKRRPLGIPAMLNRADQTLHALALEPVAETTADPDSYGFRPLRSVHDAVTQAYLSLSQKERGSWVLEADIAACFDRIDHDWLLKNVPTDKTQLRRWLKAGYLDRNVFHKTTEGTVQGSPISPLLANLALDGLQELLTKRFWKWGTNPHRINLVRYADDFIVTGVSKEILEQEVVPAIAGFLEERGLSLSTEKTKVTHIDTGFDFLGFHFQKYRGVLIVKPTKAAVMRLRHEAAAILRAHRTAAASTLIDRLNPLLRGWTNYYRHVASKDAFSAIDWWLFHRLLSWARRRHHGKSYEWIHEKYFARFGGITLHFFSWENGERRFLYRLDRTPIRRHVKIRKDANPYDPAYEQYLEERQDRMAGDDLAGPPHTLHLRQKGCCAHCGERISIQTKWNIHHVVHRVNGGRDTLDNKVLLHPNCHRQLHARSQQSVSPGAL